MRPLIEVALKQRKWGSQWLRPAYGSGNEIEASQQPFTELDLKLLGEVQLTGRLDT